MPTQKLPEPVAMQESLPSHFTTPFSFKKHCRDKHTTGGGDEEQRTRNVSVYVSVAATPVITGRRRRRKIAASKQ